MRIVVGKRSDPEEIESEREWRPWEASSRRKDRRTV